MGVIRTAAIVLIVAGLPVNVGASSAEHSALVPQSTVRSLDCWQGSDAWLPGTIQANDILTDGSASNDTGSSDSGTCDYA